jgi:hypothetical protein
VDSALLSTIVTSVTTAASTAGVAITALVLSNKRMDRIESKLDALEARFGAGLDALTGSLHELDKRLSLIEDRMEGRAR